MFITLYYQVFLLISFFDDSEKTDLLKDDDFKPSVTVMVPCYNEETTVIPTLESILGLDYPKDKLKIIVIDDGSKDSTLSLINDFVGKRGDTQPEIMVLTKSNGGKHTALNMALEHVTTDIVGCLDADSFVDRNALKIIVKKFADPETMAVTPSIKVYNPKNYLQLMQYAEYSFGVFMKQSLNKINGIHITPGPFSMFRRSVFETIGNYHKAHNTEDFEFTLRIHRAGMKIVNAYEASVYTVAPKTIKQLYRQRLRWTQGFLQNMTDHKDMLFNSKYGNLGMLILPMAVISIIGSVYAFAVLIISTVSAIIGRVSAITTVGFTADKPNIHFSWFLISSDWVKLIMITLFGISFTGLLIGRKLSYGKYNPFSRDIFLFLFLYGLIAPLWLTRSIKDALLKRQNRWKN